MSVFVRSMCITQREIVSKTCLCRGKYKDCVFNLTNRYSSKNGDHLSLWISLENNACYCNIYLGVSLKLEIKPHQPSSLETDKQLNVI